MKKKQVPPKGVNKQQVGRPNSADAQVDQVEQTMVNEQASSLSPAQEAQLEAYTDNATIAVYSEKTQPTVLQLLQSGKNNVESLARAAFFLHQQLEAGIERTGENMTEEALFLGAAHLVSELVVLAEAAKLFTLSPEDRLKAYQMAVQMYFREGLKIFKQKGPDAPGAVDPVKLQQAIEPLLTDEQRSMGMWLAEQTGISKTAPPSSTVAMDIPRKEEAQPVQQPQQQGLLASGGSVNGI